MKGFGLFLCCLVLFSLKSQALFVEKTSVDFGKVNFWNNPVFEVKVKNNSIANLFFLPISYNENFKVWFSKSKLLPGEEATISIIYYTTEKGKFKKQIPVYYSASGEPILFNLEGQIKDFDPEAMLVCPTVNDGPIQTDAKIIIEVRDFDTDKILQAERTSLESRSGRRIDLYSSGNNYEALINNGSYRIQSYLSGYEKYDAFIDLTTYQKKYIVYLVKKIETVTVTEPVKLIVDTVVKTEVKIEENLDSVYTSEIIPLKDTVVLIKNTVNETDSIKNEELIVKNPEEEHEHELNTNELDVNKFKYNNIILVVDISTSMKYGGKIEALNASLNTLINALRAKDKVGIISLASNANVVAQPNFLTNKDSFIDLVYKLKMGGSTNAASAIELAYKLAQENKVIGGNNQVIIATDGAFTMQVSTRKNIQNLITTNANQGIYLSTIALNTNELGENFLANLANMGKGSSLKIKGTAETELLELIKKQSLIE